MQADFPISDIQSFKYLLQENKKRLRPIIFQDGLKAIKIICPLTGDGGCIAPNVGVGMLDTTICDVYLVDDAGNLVEDPVL